IPSSQIVVRDPQVAPPGGSVAASHRSDSQELPKGRGRSRVDADISANPPSPRGNPGRPKAECGAIPGHQRTDVPGTARAPERSTSAFVLKGGSMVLGKRQGVRRRLGSNNSRLSLRCAVNVVALAI